MRIETWNILLNTLIAVLLVGYGIWLRNVFRHQLASKDSTIEKLGAAIKANEAEIARLRGETAPAIAESYERLKRFAEGIASESNDLANRLKAAESKRAQTDPMISLVVLASRVGGFLEATVTFKQRVEEFIKSPHAADNISSGLVEVIGRVSEDLTARTTEFTKSLGDAQAKLR